MATEEPEPNTIGLSVLFPVFFGVVRAPPLAEGAFGPAEPDRLVVVDPLSQRLVIFQDDGDPFSAAMRTMLAMSEAMEGGRRGPPPASKASILALRTVDAAVVGDCECAVCLEALRMEEERCSEEKTDVVKEMPCGHRYHGVCIGRWLEMHGSCPICRYRMPEEEEAATKKVEGDGAEGESGGLWVRLGFRADSRQQQESLQQQDQHEEQNREEEQESPVED